MFTTSANRYQCSPISKSMSLGTSTIFPSSIKYEFIFLSFKIISCSGSRVLQQFKSRGWKKMTTESLSATGWTACHHPKPETGISFHACDSLPPTQAQGLPAKFCWEDGYKCEKLLSERVPQQAVPPQLSTSTSTSSQNGGVPWQLEDNDQE